MIIPLGLLILLGFIGLMIVLMAISDYLKKGKFDPIKSGRQHIQSLLESREIQNNQSILSNISFDGDHKRILFFYRKLSEVFGVELGYLRHDDSIRNLTSVCLNDLGIFSGEAVFCDGYFKYDTADVFIFELCDLFEDYFDPELLYKDPAISQPFPDSEDKWIESIRSMTAGEFIELLCRVIDKKKARKIRIAP